MNKHVLQPVSVMVGFMSGVAYSIVLEYILKRR